VSREAFCELKEITTAIENHLKRCFTYDKINYLMLMMVDPDVHFHVLPRYAQPQLFSDHEFNDPGWPGPPTLTQYNETGEETIQKLLQILRETFSRG